MPTQWQKAEIIEIGDGLGFILPEPARAHLQAEPGDLLRLTGETAPFELVNLKPYVITTPTKSDSPTPST